MSVSKLATLVLATLTFAFGVVAGRAVSRGPASVELPPDGAPLHDGSRYKVPVSVSQPWRGESAAPVTIVEWCDLTGTGCRELDRTTEFVLQRYAGRVRHVWRHYPEQASESSRLAHEFARIAHEQAGKFWEVRAHLLTRGEPVSEQHLPELAARFGLDMKAVSRALEGRTHAGYVAADGLFASKFGVTEAPTLFVNGTRLLGKPTLERVVRLVERELAHAEAQLARGTPVDKVYDVITSEGLWQAASSPLARRAP